MAAPTTLVLAAAAIFLLVHNRAVTGDPLRSRYAAYEAGAPGAPPFVWQEPVASARALRANEEVRMQIDRSAYRALRSWWSREMRIRLVQQTIPYFLPHALFAAVLLAIPFGLRD